jgi:hypothetical protein
MAFRRFFFSYSDGGQAVVDIDGVSLSYLAGESCEWLMVFLSLTWEHTS